MGEVSPIQGALRLYNLADVTVENALTDGAILKIGSTTAGQRVRGYAASQTMARMIFEHHGSGGYGLYLRDYQMVAGISNDAFRAFNTVQNVAAGTARGAHISLNFADSGTVTGLGVALECTLHIPNDASQAGSIYALKVAINSDGATSDTAGATAVGYIRVDNQGNATGGADVDDDAVLFDIQGHTIGAGNMIHANAALAATHLIKMRIGATIYYMLITDTPA